MTTMTDQQAAALEAAQTAADDAARAKIERRCNWIAVGIGAAIVAAIFTLLF